MARAFVSVEFLTSSPPIKVMPISMSCLFYAATSTLSRTMLTIEETGGDQWYRMYGQNQRVRAYSRNGASTPIAASAPTDYGLNTWYQGGVVFTHATLRDAYLNGGDKGTSVGNCTPDPAQLDFLLVGYTGGNPASWEGFLAEIGVWNVALSDAEMAILGNFVSPLLVRPESLIWYVPFIRDNDKDLVGGLTLGIGGTPTVAPHPRVYNPYPS